MLRLLLRAAIERSRASNIAGGFVVQVHFTVGISVVVRHMLPVNLAEDKPCPFRDMTRKETQVTTLITKICNE